MKAFTHILFSLVLLAGCTENLTELNKGEELLTLAASKQAITLDERHHAEKALELTWTSGTNYGTSKAISYSLMITAEATGENIAIDLGRKIYTQSYTTSELNDMLRNELQAQPGIEAAYRASITASVADDTRTQTAEAIFTVTPYAPVTQTLYLIGGATPNGWSADDATPMKRLQPGVFTWTGKLSASEFKFITTQGQFSPSYSRDPASADGMGLLYNSPEDEKFNIEIAGGYTVKADLLDKKVTLTPADIDTPPFEQLFFVGEADGWAFNPMTQDPVNAFIFRYGAVMQKGQFKFGTTQGSWEKMYKSTSDNCSYTSSGVIFVEGFDPDNKWLVTDDEAGKAYKIALDITPDKESMVMKEFTPFTGMWMVGDATPNGWSLDDATPLTQVDTYTFTWTGNLAKGELKFSCDHDTSWNGAWFMASEDQKEFTAGEQVITFVDKKLPDMGSIDRKWRISTAGSYTITLNQLTETMNVTKN